MRKGDFKMSMPQGSVTPGPAAGTIFVPGQGIVSITDWREDNIYDAELLPVNIPAGATYTFFRNLAIAGVPKSPLITNMITPSQLPSGHRAVVFGMHIQPALDAIAEDARTIALAGYAQFTTGDTKRERQGPVWSWPSPYGLTGIVTADGAGAPYVFASVNNGIPSPVSTGKMQIPVDLNQEITFQATIAFPAGATLTAATMVYFILRAFINTPVR